MSARQFWGASARNAKKATEALDADKSCHTGRSVPALTPEELLGSNYWHPLNVFGQNVLTACATVVKNWRTYAT